MARHRRTRDNADDLPRVPLTRETLRQALALARYLLPYRVKFAAALLALTLASLLSLAFPYMAGTLVDSVLKGSTPLAASNFELNRAAIGLIVVLALQSACAFFRFLWFNDVAQRSLADLRRDTFARLLRLPMAFHGQRRVGELGSRLSTDLAQIQDTLTEAIPQFLRQSAILVGGIVLIALTSWRLTVLMLVTVPVLVVAAVIFGEVIRKVAKEAQDRLAESNVVVEESLQNIATVKAFANEPFEESRYRSRLNAYLTVALRGATYQGAFVAFIVFALFGSLVLVLWYGARLVLAGDLSAGELTRFMLYTLYVSGAVGSFAELYSQVQRTLGASQRVRELLRELTEQTGGGVHPDKHARGEASFENITFRYPGRPEIEVLRGVNLEVKAGQRVAVAGPSGAGKSTLVSLLLRFYDPEAGRVVLDGRDVRDYDLQELRRLVAVVPQEVILFGGTIEENIAYGRPGASLLEVEEAARQANAHEFVAAFPQGYQTTVGERGVQLSGGQRQRIAIARAILRDPALLILDEATSSLDAQSERLVLEALDRLSQGRTALVIAHRLSTVRSADRIFVLQDGRTVEAGTHEELVTRTNGVYQNLSRLQLDPGDRAPAFPEDQQWPRPPLPSHLPS
jgi:ATP-binding cassette subfamily B protein